MAYNYGTDIDSGDAIVSPDLKIKFELAGKPTKYKVMERITNLDDSYVYDQLSWKSITDTQRTLGYVTYSLTRPDLYGNVVISTKVGDASGRVSNAKTLLFYYGSGQVITNNKFPYTLTLILS